MKYKMWGLIPLLLGLLLTPTLVFGDTPAATLTQDGDPIGSYETVQEAVDAVSSITVDAPSEFVIEIASGTVSEPLNILQQENKSISIYPRDNAKVIFTNTITIDGNGRFNGEERVLIQGISFDLSAGSPAEGIYLKQIPPRTTYCYAHNVTINGCDFTGVEGTTVAVQSVAGGMRNIAIINCTATNMHSLAQLKAVSGKAFIQNCMVTNSEAGVNFYGPADMMIDSCQFDVTDYAVRSGQGSGAISSQGSLLVNNSILKSSSMQDGVIVLRGDSTATIQIIHSRITNTNENGSAIQNLNLASADDYQLLLEETDVSGAISDIGEDAVTVIDDPNVANGPVNTAPEPTPQWGWWVVLALVIVAFIGWVIAWLCRPRCCCCC